MPHERLCVSIDEQNGVVYLYLCELRLCTIDFTFPLIKLFNVVSYSDTVRRCVNCFTIEFCHKSLYQICKEADKELAGTIVSTNIDAERVMCAIKWYYENGKEIL